MLLRRTRIEKGRPPSAEANFIFLYPSSSGSSPLEQNLELHSEYNHSQLAVFHSQEQLLRNISNSDILYWNPFC